jgi:hypothetical protein
VQLEEIHLPTTPARLRTSLEQMKSIETWSSKDVDRDVIEPGKQLLGVQSMRLTSFLSYLGASKMRFVLCSLMLTLFAMALLLAPWNCLRSHSDHDLSDFQADPLPDLASAVESGNGSWAHTYRRCQGEQKDALELLYQCKIVSVQEFTHSSASQEHIDECVWIASQMLRQKPLEEWVVWRQQALQSFEDSITAIFAARTTAVYGKDYPWNGRAKGGHMEGPSPTPLQGALHDLLSLKGFPSSPVLRSGYTASTAPASPVSSGLLPTWPPSPANSSSLSPGSTNDTEEEKPVRYVSAPCTYGGRADADHAALRVPQL